MPLQGEWVYFRRKPSKYPKTAQQQKIEEAGKKIAEECTGLRDEEFKTCRSKVLKDVFHPATEKSPD